MNDIENITDLLKTNATNYTSVMSLEDLDCPVYTDNSEGWIDYANFWVSGVTSTCIAIPGFIGNLVFSFVLTRKEMRNSFNLLLVALAFFDSCYLIGAQLESIRVSFGMVSNAHVMLFPYFLYPGKDLASTLSIFMIVAISLERYIAVHNPLDYNQSNNDPNAKKKRLVKYLFPVIIVSILFNISKFFEATYITTTEQDSDGFNITKAHVDVTKLRIHPIYSSYSMWSQSLVLGFFPAAFLVYFNMKIYLEVRDRERRKRPKGHIESSQHQSGSGSLSSAPNNAASNNSNRCCKAEDRLAILFSAIVTGFLVTNFPRILLNFHEIWVFDNMTACTNAGMPGFSVWCQILNSFSLMLMVVNSSMNIIFYGLFNTQFRRVAKNIFFKDKHSSTMNGNSEIRIGGRHHRQNGNDDGVELVDVSKKDCQNGVSKV